MYTNDQWLLAEAFKDGKKHYVRCRRLPPSFSDPRLPILIQVTWRYGASPDGMPWTQAS